MGARASKPGQDRFVHAHRGQDGQREVEAVEEAPSQIAGRVG